MIENCPKPSFPRPCWFADLSGRISFLGVYTHLNFRLKCYFTQISILLCFRGDFRALLSIVPQCDVVSQSFPIRTFRDSGHICKQPWNAGPAGGCRSGFCPNTGKSLCAWRLLMQTKDEVCVCLRETRSEGDSQILVGANEMV